VALLRHDGARPVVLDANAAFRGLLGLDDVDGLDLVTVAGPDEVERESTDVDVRFRGVDLVGERHNYRRADGSAVTVHVFEVLLERTPTPVVMAFLVDSGRMDTLMRRFYREAETAAALAEVRGALLRDAGTEVVMELICSWTRRLLGADNAGILQVIGGGSVTLLATDLPGRPARGSSWRLADGNFATALESGADTSYTVPKDTIVAAGIADTFPTDDDGRLHVAVAPITAAGRRFGALTVRRGAAAFDADDMALLEMFAEGVSDALTVAARREELERLRVGEVRQEIGRNLHDEVIQDLIGVRLAIDGLERQAWNPLVTEQLRSLRDDLTAATRRLRDVVAGVDDAAAAGTFGESMRSLIASRALRHGMGWTVELEGSIEEIASDGRAEVLRVLNEAVSNVVRHADATQVDVALRVDETILELRVCDDGIGPVGVAGATGMGLRNLRARAEERAGGCTVIERTGGGTTLSWWIPRPARGFEPAG
jgi:signal transduction histidine kinase